MRLSPENNLTSFSQTLALAAPPPAVSQSSTHDGNQNEIDPVNEIKTMQHTQHYRIEYLFHGKPRWFYVCARQMDNAEAWHWAAVDAGVADIPKYRSDRAIKLSKPKAERLGIDAVSWKPA